MKQLTKFFRLLHFTYRFCVDDMQWMHKKAGCCGDFPVVLYLNVGLKTYKQLTIKAAYRKYVRQEYL